MMKKVRRYDIAALIISIFFFVTACDKEENVPQQDVFEPQMPVNFPQPVYTFDKNPLTREGFELGRMLFYDPILSADETIACGNCHKQAAAFADIDHRVSHGVDNQNGTRNTPAIFNTLWRENFFWDGGVNHLEVLPLAPITNPIEMGETLEGVIGKLNNSPKYPAKFKAVFGKETIDSQQMLKALAQFMGKMTSANSRYDKYTRGEGGELTTLEKEGQQVFQLKCASCHSSDLFTDGSFRNNGLDTDFTQDEGRSLITHEANDQGKFRVPSLRNIELTAPYMHDGRFKTLAQVLNHYASGVNDSPTLDPALKSNGRLGIVLLEEEKVKIIAFLHTLTDRSFTTDPIFSEPRQ